MFDETEILVTKAYRYMKRDYPVPLDLMIELFASDVSPEDLQDMVEEGYTLEECLDMLCYGSYQSENKQHEEEYY